MNKLLAAGLVSVAMVTLACENQSGKAETNVTGPLTSLNTEQRINDYGADSTNSIFQPDVAEEPNEGLPDNQKPQHSVSSGTNGIPKPIGSGTAFTPLDHKIIKHASLALEVKSFYDFFVPVRRKLQDLGCYIAAENQSQDEHQLANTVSIRVPVTQFETALEMLTATGVIIKERSITSQDVTIEIVDIRSRIEAKKKVRDRYMELLGKAKNMEEILTVQTEINQVQEQVEASMGRRAYLSNATAYSTIDIKYYQLLNPAQELEPANTTGHRFWKGIRAGWFWVTELVIRLLVLWPLAVAAIVGIIIYRRKKMTLKKVHPAGIV